jgi:SHS2 domain-containing protein
MTKESKRSYSLTQKEKEKLKDSMIKIIESKIKNNAEPSLEYDKEKGSAYHWLSELWAMAEVQGEINSLRSCRQILNGDLNELDDIESLFEKNLRNRTLQ